MQIVLDFSFTVEAPAEGKEEYIVGIAGEDLGETGADIAERRSLPL